MARWRGSKVPPISCTGCCARLRTAPLIDCDNRRGRALGESPQAQAPESGHDPLAAAELHRLLLQLQPDARAVMILRYQEDLDPTDIAALLDMPVPTVKSHLRRSLEWLRTQCAGETHGS
jgi:DNA-directed RNA polymerase specialized sigma24 family protein